MNAQRWLHELRTELVRRKLPPLYVERMVLELSDHLSNLLEDRMSTDAKDLHGVFDRLGSPGSVAASAVREFRKARFSQRHPVLMFVVLPVLSLPFVWALKLLLVVALIQVLGITEGSANMHSSVWKGAEAALPYVMIAMTALPIAVAAVCFCILARRAAVSWKWLLTTAGLLAIIGSAGIAQLTLPTATTKGTLSFGLGFNLYPSPLQLLQFSIPLAICGWAIWRQAKASRQSVLA